MILQSDFRKQGSEETPLAATEIGIRTGWVFLGKGEGEVTE